MDLEKELDKLQDENAALREELRSIDHKSMADTLERSNAVIAQYKAERDELRAWRDNLTCNGEVGACSYLVRDGGSMSFFLARGNCHEIIFDTLDCEKVAAKLTQLQANYDTIPVDDLRQIANESQLASWSSIRYLRDWLASLDGAA